MTGPQQIALAPADQSYLGIPGPALQFLLLAVALAAFAWIMYRRITVLRRAAPDPRLDNIGQRVKRALVVGFGQSRQPRYRVAGILHILIFFGFLILSLRSLTLLGEGFSAGFTLPGLGGAAGGLYALLKEWTALVVILCCLVAGVRRLVFKPARYHDRNATVSHTGEALLILGLICFLMVADTLYEGSQAALTGEAVPMSLPLVCGAAALLAGGSTPVLNAIHLASFWLHNAALLFFLCYLPVSKHFHVISAIPNVFFSKLAPTGTVKPPRHDEPDMDKIDALGAGCLEDFTWKHVLDFYSCTDCGRCSDACPAYATGTPLSPRMISIKSRDLAYAVYPVRGTFPPAGSVTPLVGPVVADEEIWACTTCGACEETCPVTIEYLDKIVDMRRHLVDEGRVPASLQKPMADLEKRGNPYGKMPRKRGDWAGSKNVPDCGVRTLKKGEEADLLVFTDSCAAFDPRIQEISQALGRVMERAGLDAGTLGKDESDSGHEARRLGEEGLFEDLRDRNMEALEERSYQRLVTADPHAFNALTHDYPELEQPVLHHSQLLAELVQAGKLPLGNGGKSRTVTFHDPCYLGRHNGLYDAPRRVLDALPGLKTVEMQRSKNRSFCCGGGSLYLFYEGECDKRMGELRLEMAAEAGADTVVTACPFCLINLEDAIKTTGREGTMEVIDLAELVEQSLVREETA
jgi:Fe-S oxidoreductase